MLCYHEKPGIQLVEKNFTHYIVVLIVTCETIPIPECFGPGVLICGDWQMRPLAPSRSISTQRRFVYYFTLTNSSNSVFALRLLYFVPLVYVFCVFTVRRLMLQITCRTAGGGGGELKSNIGFKWLTNRLPQCKPSKKKAD